MNFNFLLLIFINCSLTTLILSQPGHTFVNLNNGIGDYIIIDSTTNLNRIEILKERKKLRLIINLEKIPTQFKNFISLETLTIQSDNQLTDLSALNYFPNLKQLFIFRYSGETISSKKLKLDSLKTLRITDAINLKKIDAITELILLEDLNISHTPNIKTFPKFHPRNQVKSLIVDYVNDRRNEEFNNYLNNIKYLTKLESITLGNIKGINEIPDYLPPSISYLEINGWSQKHWADEKIEINDLSNIKLYPNLKSLKLYYVHINSGVNNSVQELSKIHLDNLYLDYVWTQNNISWVFTFKGVNNLRLRHCFDLQSFQSEKYTDNITSITIDHLPELQTINFLFKLKNTKQLDVQQVPRLDLPDIEAMETIPNISIFTSSKYMLFKKDNIWTKKEYYK